jgi:hypothetical protein
MFFHLKLSSQEGMLIKAVAIKQQKRKNWYFFLSTELIKTQMA